MGGIRMIKPSRHMRRELRPYFSQLVETYALEPHHAIWVELMAGLLHMREHQPKKFTDETAGLLASFLRQLPPRR